MKLKFTTPFFCILFVVIFNASAWAAHKDTPPPDTCGDLNIAFDIQRVLNPPSLGDPPAGKAQIVFVGRGNRVIDAVLNTSSHVRYGLDGAWAGASEGSSYFVVNVEPGTHQICIRWETQTSRASFNAEAGKTYYWQAKKITSKNPFHAQKLQFSQLLDDEGKQALKETPLGIPKVRKTDDPLSTNISPWMEKQVY